MMPLAVDANPWSKPASPIIGFDSQTPMFKVGADRCSMYLRFWKALDLTIRAIFVFPSPVPHSHTLLPVRYHPFCYHLLSFPFLYSNLSSLLLPPR